jgi:hypothetical protein
METSKQQLRRARIIAILLGSTTVFSICSLVFAFIQKTEANVASQKAINCLEEQIKLTEQLKQSEQRAAMESFRAEHLQESLTNQQKITEEMLKQRLRK